MSNVTFYPPYNQWLCRPITVGIINSVHHIVLCYIVKYILGKHVGLLLIYIHYVFFLHLYIYCWYSRCHNGNGLCLRTSFLSSPWSYDAINTSSKRRLFFHSKWNHSDWNIPFTVYMGCDLIKRVFTCLKGVNRIVSWYSSQKLTHKQNYIKWHLILSVCVI